MKHLYLIILSVCLLAVTGCREDEPDFKFEDKYGYAPETIEGKTLILSKDNGKIYLSADHLSESGVSINNQTVDYKKYPPSYHYSATNYNQASYHLEVTKITYIPYYGTNHYSKFVFDVNLEFTSKYKGSYRGTEMNAEGTIKNISGTFILN